MLSIRLVPCLDIDEGRVVKGERFQNLRDVGSVLDLARRYEEEGADELVLLDISATPSGRSHALDTVRQVRAQIGLPITAGGGVTSVDSARAMLQAGADKIGINSAAVARPELIDELRHEFGAQCVVLSVDARRSGERWTTITHSGEVDSRKDVIAWCAEGEQRGAGEILLTSWDRDGTGSGYDAELVRAVRGAVRLPIIASGGAATAQDFVTAARAGASAVLAASIFHDRKVSVGEVKRVMQEAGVEVRP